MSDPIDEVLKILRENAKEAKRLADEAFKVRREKEAAFWRAIEADVEIEEFVAKSEEVQRFIYQTLEEILGVGSLLKCDGDFWVVEKIRSSSTIDVIKVSGDKRKYNTSRMIYVSNDFSLAKVTDIPDPKLQKKAIKMIAELRLKKLGAHADNQ